MSWTELVLGKAKVSHSPTSEAQNRNSYLVRDTARRSDISATISLSAAN